MSEGGALDYVEYKIQNIANDLEDSLRKRGENKALYRAFVAHLRRCAEAAHHLEWVLSNDAPPGSEIGPLKALIGSGATLSQLIDEAHAVAKELREELENATSGMEFVKRNERRYTHGAKTVNVAGNHSR